jgi:hypothetical protein
MLLAARGITDSSVDQAFKMLSGHERHLVPRSEYLFLSLQPLIEDLLFLGTSYEDLFDRLEVLIALAFADWRKVSGGSVWGPPGRFAYKFREHGRGAFKDVNDDVEREEGNWLGFRAGLFGGSKPRFSEAWSRYRDLMSRLDLF